jgi:heptosyltransferase-2
MPPPLRHEKVAVICPHGIGNLIMTLPALLTLRRGFPHWEIHLVSLLPSTTTMLRSFPLFNELCDHLHEISLSRNPIALIRSLAALRRIRPTMSLVTFPSLSFHYNLLNFLIGAPKRIGSLYPDSRFSTLAWLNTHQHQVVVGAHDVEQNLMLMRMLGTPGVEFHDFGVAADHYRFEKNRVIGFHTGCKKKDSYRQWSPERYAAVIERLLDEEAPYRLRMFFGPDELEHLAFFQERLSGREVECVYGLGLLEVAQKVGECSIFVSNDSGLMHLAVLTQCPHVISMWGPSDPDRTGPYDARATVIRSGLRCMPCSHSYTIGSRRFHCTREIPLECLAQVTEERVVSEVQQAIKADQQAVPSP